MAKSNGAFSNRVVEIRDLSKTYTPGCEDCAVLNGVSLDISTGDFVVLLGVSGSGKSTLLNLISGLDQPTSGSVRIDGTEITALNEYQRTIFRRNRIGIVFQFFNLIPTLTVLENITLPLELRGDARKRAAAQARALLDRVGLAHRANDFPDKLSGGEQQRIAIARALIHQPALVLADEPTANLDEDTGGRVLSLLLELTRQAGRTLLMATHNPDIVPLADRVYRIQEGHLVPAVEAPRPIQPKIQ